jgi:hypothetical protein
VAGAPASLHHGRHLPGQHSLAVKVAETRPSYENSGKIESSNEGIANNIPEWTHALDLCLLSQVNEFSALLAKDFQLLSRVLHAYGKEL